LDLKDIQNFKLLPAIEEKNCLYSAQFNLIKYFRNVKDSTILCDTKNTLFVLRQVAPESFKVVKKIDLEEKSRACVVTALEISVKNGLLLIGTQEGYFYSYDMDLMGFSYKGRPYVDPVIEVKFVECLGNIYVISKTKQIKVYDSQNYNMIQMLTFSDGDIGGCWKWGFMSDLDSLFFKFRSEVVAEYELLEKERNKVLDASGTSSTKGQGQPADKTSKEKTQEKFHGSVTSGGDFSNRDFGSPGRSKITGSDAKKLTGVHFNKRGSKDNLEKSKWTDGGNPDQSPPKSNKANPEKIGDDDFDEEELLKEQRFDERAKALLVEQMSEMGLKFYVGNTEILELNFHVRKREQFKEQIYKYDLLHNNEPSLKIGNEEDRWEFYRQYLSTENHWTHIAYSSDSKNMVFLNNVKF
jgi:hypothetical protein